MGTLLALTELPLVGIKVKKCLKNGNRNSLKQKLRNLLGIGSTKKDQIYVQSTYLILVSLNIEKFLLKERSTNSGKGFCLKSMEEYAKCAELKIKTLKLII